MDLVRTKRDSLEQFIREQMVGPNSCNGKFSYNDKEFNAEIEEVINATPGSIYSTAILFPDKKGNSQHDVPHTSSEENAQSADDSADDSADEYEPSETDANESLGILGGDDTSDDDVYSMSRRFPNIIGLSCCVDGKANLNTDLKVTISGRYYTKINRNDKEKLLVLIKDDTETFEAFWKENVDLHQYFVYDGGKLSMKIVDSPTYLNLKELLLNKNRFYAEGIAKEFDVLDFVRESSRYLVFYRERLFEALNHIQKDNTYLTEDQKANYMSAIEKIERYETIISYFNDLMAMFDGRGFGYWMSHTFSKEINLTELAFEDGKTKQVFKPDKYPDLSDVVYVNLASNHDVPEHLSLSVWIQVVQNTKYAADDKRYVKVLVQNTSSPFVENGGRYYSIINEDVNRRCFFGLRISIASKYILPYHEHNLFSDTSREEDNLDFLYRNLSDYAVGHLCSASWSTNDMGKVDTVYSEFLPSYETPDIESEPRDKFGEYVLENNQYVPPRYLTDNKCLQFKELSTFSDASNREVVDYLTQFVDTYFEWIKKTKSHKYSTEEERFVNYYLDACYADYTRMRNNITDILATDDDNVNRFRLMNSAMFMQLWHSKEENQRYILDNQIDIQPEFYKNASDEIFEKGKPAAWRPFQLAFILLNLDGLIRRPDDKKWESRNECVDLVWFPTGGGKTEAYLGLIALCIINRRQRYGAQGGGVSAFMRYTLRLLTKQQFQRALRLILALEQIRLWGGAYSLGEEPISIGLFVGGGTLSNSRAGLVAEADNWVSREEGRNNTQIPLDRCPWCGERLTQEDGKFYCSNDECTFSDMNDSLPVLLCDEDIYKTPPTLLFGTVDKFAAIAHKVSTIKSEKNDDSRRLFGRSVGCLPPDLIIQDELHLLLGPLGSAVGLFECAIDQLCSRTEVVDGCEITVRPKIISSTATTRNTELQIRALYDRKVNIFPKSGVTHDDSFFSFYKRESVNGSVRYVSKRKYLGILPTGRTQKTAEMRLTAIVLAHRAIFEREHISEDGYEKAADNYFSIISYFNSLKEVGKTDALFYTEYTKYVRAVIRRVLRFGQMLECFYAMDGFRKAELSGRLNSSEINEVFKEVGEKWKLEKRLPFKQIENGEEVWVNAATPPDYILATNMISVGLDVSRFNTILMNSMPRNIAEYIQASSRVARSVPGLVISIHNPFRSRDVSHFEKFREFHEKLYYYVEPISITPFSKKSIDRYLALYMAAMIRHHFDKLANRKSAINITDAGLADNVKSYLAEYFFQRYMRTQGLDKQLKELLTKELYEYICEYIDKAIDQWVALAGSNPPLLYSKTQKEIATALYTMPNDYDENRNDGMWAVPVSLRSIDPEAVFNIKINTYGN